MNYGEIRRSFEQLDSFCSEEDAYFSLISLNASLRSLGYNWGRIASLVIDETRSALSDRYSEGTKTAQRCYTDLIQSLEDNGYWEELPHSSQAWLIRILKRFLRTRTITKRDCETIDSICRSVPFCCADDYKGTFEGTITNPTFIVRFLEKNDRNEVDEARITSLLDGSPHSQYRHSLCALATDVNEYLRENNSTRYVDAALVRDALLGRAPPPIIQAVEAILEIKVTY